MVQTSPCNHILQFPEKQMLNSCWFIKYIASNMKLGPFKETEQNNNPLIMTCIILEK